MYALRDVRGKNYLLILLARATFCEMHSGCPGACIIRYFGR